MGNYMTHRFSHLKFIYLPIVIFTPVLATAFGSNASAQNALCSFLSGDARRVCNAAAELSRASQNREPTPARESQQPDRQNSSQTPTSAGPSGSSNSSSNALQPDRPNSVSAQNRIIVDASEGAQYPLIEGMLNVAIQGAYPANYKPNWQTGFASLKSVQVDTVDSGRRGTAQGTRELQFAIIDNNGKLTLAFDYGIISTLCYADIEGIGRTIGRQLQPFRLSNFRVGETPSYARRTKVGDACNSSSYEREYSGEGSIRSTSNGDVFLTFGINFDNRARYVAPFSSTYRSQEILIANSVTPAMAVADLARKTRIAQETATREAARVRALELAASQRAQVASNVRAASRVPGTVPATKGNRTNVAMANTSATTSGSRLPRALNLAVLKSLDEALSQDSKSRFFDNYVIGSVRNARYLGEYQGNMIVAAQYQTNADVADGQFSSVRGMIGRSGVECLEFSEVGCQPVSSANSFAGRLFQQAVQVLPENIERGLSNTNRPRKFCLFFNISDTQCAE
jgi:hypothetical protein